MNPKIIYNGDSGKVCPNCGESDKTSFEGNNYYCKRCSAKFQRWGLPDFLDKDGNLRRKDKSQSHI